MIRYVLNTLGSFRPALAVGVGLPFLMAASAFAQDEATTERVIVTGSYIPTAETESALPVTIYTAEVLQKQGANTPVEGLRQLPSFVGNTLTENDSNGGNGSAAVSLRGLGPENALTLMNGRRAFLGILAINGAANINAIPIGGLSRTEVLKDGASAVYGSDAVAGVVNFIMLNGPGEKPYEGAELYALYGNTTETDAHVRHVYLRGGVTGLDGKVAIAAAGEYYSRANLFSRDRFAVAGTADQTNTPTGLNRGGRNTNSPNFGGRVSINNPGQPGLELVLVNLQNQNPSSVINGTDPGGYRFFEVAPGTASTDPSRFNFRAETPAIPAQEKAMYFITGRYKIFGDGLQLYGDILYSKTKQDNGLAGAPFSSSSVPNSAGLAGLQVARNSQFNPFGGRLASYLYRFHLDEVGSRRQFFDQDYYRYVIGVNGDFNFKDNSFISHFGYDSGFVYERADGKNTKSGTAVGSLLGDEITAGNFNPFIGQSALTQGTARIYNNTNSTQANYRNGVSIGTATFDNQAAARRASTAAHSFDYEADWLADAKINAHLFPNLWNGGIDVALGYEHRESRIQAQPDPSENAGLLLGFNGASDYKFRQEVESIFGELTIPFITSPMNIPFVRSFEFSFAYRFEEFTNFDLFPIPGTNEISFDNGGTPRLSLRYQPIADLTLRASWGQSFRSPTPSDLFLPTGSTTFPQMFDPLRFEVLQPGGGVSLIGNPDLQPEQTDAYTAGVVWTPKFAPGFTMTVDWYQLFTSNLIASGSDFAQIILTQNGYSGLANNGIPTLFTAQVRRNPGPFGLLTGIRDAPTANAGKRLVQGLDVTTAYEIPFERFGKFTLSGGWNHFFTWKAQALPESGFTNFLGNYNNGTLPLAPGAIPFNKAFVRAEWQWRGFDFIATGNYIGDFEDDAAFFGGNAVLGPNQTIGVNIANPEFLLHHRVSEYQTLDMQLSYEFIKPDAEPAPTVKDSKDSKNIMQTEAATSSIWQRMLWGTKLTVGVNNVFDRYPPTVLGAFNDNYDTSLYSIRNRYWYASMSKKF